MIMRNTIIRFLYSQAGQAFPMALVVLAMGSLFVGGFLASVNTNFLIADVYSDPIPDNYTADAGIEDALWGLRYGTLADTVESEGGQYTYTLPNQVNGTNAEITVGGLAGGKGTEQIIAQHNFEAVSWTGGTGWIAGWSHTGLTDITSQQSPYQGLYHARVRGTNAYMERSVDVSGYFNVKLRFWAKADSLEGGDSIICRVSPDGLTWNTVQIWASGDADNVYRYYDIDLSAYTLSADFRIAFLSSFGDNTDYFYFDEIQVIGVPLGAREVIATHNFDLGMWTGGIGWLSGWVHQGSTSIITSQDPAQGTHHVQMRGSNANLKRDIDLSERSIIRLQFWGKVRSFESGDALYVRVSPDNVNWYTVKTFDSTYSDDTYWFYDIDLSSYTMTSQFWIAFESGMSANNDYFYFDDIKIVGVAGTTIYQIVSVAGERTTTVTVDTFGGSTIINSWELE